MTLKRRWIHEVFNLNVLSTTEKRSRNYHDHHRWKKDSPKIDRLRSVEISVEISYCYTVLRAAFIYCFKNIYILEKEQGKSRKGKKHQIRKRKKTHYIIDIRQSSRQRAVSPFRFSLSRESKKMAKKKVPIKKIIIIITVIISNNTN